MFIGNKNPERPRPVERSAIICFTPATPAGIAKNHIELIAIIDPQVGITPATTKNRNRYTP